MGYEKYLRKGKISPDEAIEMVKSGQCVALSPVCAEPETLIESLAASKDRLEDVEIYTMMPLGECPYVRPEMAGHFKVKTFSIGPRLMEPVSRGQAEYIPCHLSQIPVLFSDGTIQVDVALLQLSPPDRKGFCSLGVSVGYIRPVVERAKIVIAEINEQMPRTMGDTLVHLSQVDYAVEASHPLPTIPQPKITEVEKRIAGFVSDLIPDGAVLQIGIGNISDAILEQLREKRGLRIHTGSFSDGVIKLVESGALEIKGSGSIVSMDLMGTKKLYDFCHENSIIEMRPIEYTHAIQVLSQIKGLVSVSSGIQIDLSGQVNSEMRGETLINGVGGQLDFLRGAAASPGGKSVIAFPSTAKKGEISRIISKLAAGSSATVGRADIDSVVTEYGVARLRGKSLPERARELIAVAHPKFREELKHAYGKTNI